MPHELFRAGKIVGSRIPGEAQFVETVIVESTRRYYRDVVFRNRVEEAVRFIERFFVRDDGESYGSDELKRIRIMLGISFYLDELRAFKEESNG